MYAAGDQLDWNAVYADRPGRVDASTVTLHLPADVASTDLKTSVYRITSDQDSAVGALPAGTGAEVRAQFPHGLVSATAPAWQADADRADWVAQTLAPIGGFLALLLSLAILGAGGVLVFLTWYAGGRDPSPGSVPSRLDRPPSEMPAPLAGTLVDEVADVQDAVATLVDLAQRGVLVLTDEDDPKLAGSSHDVRVALGASPQAAASLRPYERVLLAALFGRDPQSGSEVRLSEVRGRFAASIPVLQDHLHQAVAEVGLFV